MREAASYIANGGAANVRNGASVLPCLCVCGCRCITALLSSSKSFVQSVWTILGGCCWLSNENMKSHKYMRHVEGQYMVLAVGLPPRTHLGWPPGSRPPLYETCDGRPGDPNRLRASVADGMYESSSAVGNAGPFYPLLPPSAPLSPRICHHPCPGPHLAV